MLAARSLHDLTGRTMTGKLIVIQHHPAEQIGELGVWAERRAIKLETYRADHDEWPPHDGAPCVLLGGPYSVNDPPDWLQREKVRLRERLASDAPVLGICLGSQLLAEALGSCVTRMQRPETGWTEIRFAEGVRLDALQWHEDAFDLPPGATSLACSSAWPHQMFSSSAGRHRLGIQFHPEWNAKLVAALNAHFGAASPLPNSADFERHARVARWFHAQLDSWWRD